RNRAFGSERDGEWERLQWRLLVHTRVRKKRRALADRGIADDSDSAINWTWKKLICRRGQMNGRSGNASPPVDNRAWLFHGSKRNQVVRLGEIEQYGIDSFADDSYISIYGMPPKKWYRLGIRLLGRTAVECTRDALGDRIGLDVASVVGRMPSNQVVVIDPF